MAAKAGGLQRGTQGETFFQNEAVSLCLLINRRARTMRVIDFRAGATDAKRLLVQSLARSEGVEKLYTLVERDEVQTWVKLGFVKEGNVPGFYKRSDAFILGCLVAPHEPKTARAFDGRAAEDLPLESETRIIAAATAAAALPPSVAHDVMERTIAAGKRGLRLFGDKSPHVKLTELGEVEARKAVSAATRSGRALTAFEPFGRGVERDYLVATIRGGFELFLSTECQGCFGNAFLEILTAPRTDAECVGTAAALDAVCARLEGAGTVSCFSLAPSDDVALASAFLHNGYRRTGLLQEHLLLGGKRKDAILWSRKLANPADE